MKGKIAYRRKLNADGEYEEVNEYFLDGQEVTEAEFNAVYPDQSLEGMADLMTPFPKCWPMYSESMEVHVKQIDLAKKLDQKLGAPKTDYDSLGRPIWTSEDHKRKYIKSRGVHDNNSFYG